MPKRQPIVVSGKFPSDAEVAAVLGISPRRKKELDRMMEEYFRQKRMRLSKTARQEMDAMIADDPARAEPHRPLVFLNFPYDQQFVPL